MLKTWEEQSSNQRAPQGEHPHPFSHLPTERQLLLWILCMFCENNTTGGTSILKSSGTHSLAWLTLLFPTYSSPQNAIFLGSTYESNLTAKLSETGSAGCLSPMYPGFQLGNAQSCEFKLFMP